MDSSDAHDRLMWMLDLYTRPMIGVAVRLGIPDLVAEGEKTSEELALHTGQHVGALGRMMRALSARGVFRERLDGRFGLTPISELLCAGTSGSLRAMALWRTADSPARVAEALAHTVETGEPTTLKIFGKSLFENLASHPQDLEIFTSLMASGNNPGVLGNRHVLAACCGAFDAVGTPGGRGRRAGTVAGRGAASNALSEWCLLDRAEVIASARGFLEGVGVLDRVELVSAYRRASSTTYGAEQPEFRPRHHPRHQHDGVPGWSRTHGSRVPQPLRGSRIQLRAVVAHRLTDARSGVPPIMSS